MDVLILAVVSFISSLCGFIGATYALKRFDFYGVFIDSADALLGDEQNLAKVYGLGQLLGRGFMEGAGLGKIKKRGGKIFGIPAELIMPFVQKFLPQVQKSEQTTVSEYKQNI